MLRSLVRWKFVDRTWTATDLDDLAEFWLRVSDAAARSPDGSAKSDQRLALHLTGFPRSATVVASDELTRRLSEAGLSVTVSAKDPDELVAKTKPRRGSRRPFAGLGVHTLAGAPFDGMLIEIRYTVTDAGATKQKPGHFGATLVVVGELREGAVAVKSVWADPAFVRFESHWDNPTGWEEHILTAFDQYRRDNKVSVALADWLFEGLLRPPASEAEYLRVWRWLFDVPEGRPRLGGLLRRFAVLLVLCILIVFFIALAIEQKGEPLWQILAYVLGLLVLVLVLGFAPREYRRLITDGNRWRDWYAALFRRPARYEAVPLDANTPWRADPTVRKLTAELVEAGFIHAADVTTIPTESAGDFHRMFRAPDGTTYLTLAFTFAGGSGAARSCIWPAKNTSILCQTFFSAGKRFETFNFEHPLHTLRREVPTCRRLVAPTTTQPVDLYRLHIKAVAEWLAGERVSRVSHEPIEHVIARQEEISQEECRAYHQQPYSWDDRIRWYLQLDTRPRPSDDSK